MTSPGGVTLLPKDHNFNKPKSTLYEDASTQVTSFLAANSLKDILKYFSLIFIFKNLTPYYYGPTFNLGVTIMGFYKLVMNQTLPKDASTQNTAFLKIQKIFLRISTNFALFLVTSPRGHS